MHIMLDIETLSTSPDALVLSIGAVAFSTRDTLAPVEFYAVLDYADQEERHISMDTVEWWMDQAQNNPKAADVFKDGEHIEHVAFALQRLTTYINTWASKDDCIWANGPDFDCVILRTLFEANHLALPWRHTQHRCFRTFKALAKQQGVNPTVDVGMPKHNALADAEYQALYVIEAAKELGLVFG